MPGRPIGDVARDLGLAPLHLHAFGADKAKVALAALDATPRGEGALVLVSALTPTAGGEGKTTVSVGLSMALARLGRRAVACLRQPSQGPLFGSKGGGTGGGRATLLPAEDINLHFTGDLHAVASAHNLLAALADNELHFGGKLDARKVTWPRVVDVNDRALRHVVVGLGGPQDGVPREARFDITAASEIMAVLCLARSHDDLRRRLGRIVVGRSHEDGPVTAEDLGATGAMDVLLAHAIEPNLVQTAEGTPALVHGGPFANIAHGASSVLASELGGRYADYVVTEAGFGFDLGGEKFLHLVCPTSGIWPRTVVLVVTVRALLRHGGSADPTLEGLERGLSHLDRQLANVRAFGIDPVVATNVFAGDPEALLGRIDAHCRAAGVRIARVTAHAEGGTGAVDLAHHVVESSAGGGRAPSALYRAEQAFAEKTEAVARRLYGARGVVFTAAAARDLERFTRWGHGALPPCIAKTPLSLSDDPSSVGVPTGFDLTITSVRLAAGAGFLVALAGDVQTMPGLPHDPAARRVHLDADGKPVGLMPGS